MKNNQIKTACGIAGVVFIALSFLWEFGNMVFDFIGLANYGYDFMRVDSVYYLLPILSLFRFAAMVVAFAFGIISLTREGKKTVVAEIVLAVSFFSSFFYMQTIYAICAAILISISAILYSIYFVSVITAQSTGAYSLKRKVALTFDEKMSKLVSYKHMLDEGLISDEEFAAIKKSTLEE